jgi:DNA mismatch repair protein MutS
MECSPDQLDRELERIRPAEVLADDATLNAITLDVARTRLPDWHFDVEAGARRLREQLGVASLVAFGAETLTAALAAAGALLNYAAATQSQSLRHVIDLTVEHESEFIGLDTATRRNLELTETLRGQESPTLFSLLDTCATSMGSRLLRHWLHHPLRDRAVPQARQQAIEVLLGSDWQTLRATLRTLSDVERITGRLALLSARPRDLSSLRDTLARLPEIREELPKDDNASDAAPLLAELYAALTLPADAHALLQRAVTAEPAAMVRDGGVIARGYDADLDELRDISENCGQFLVDLEARERERTGIANLRVEYNRVHGFYIEVTNGQAAKVPDDYRRRQTLKNAERYITPELKAFEDKALSAQDRALSREKLLYEELLQKLLPHLAEFKRIAAALAQADVLATLTERAHALSWSRPTLTDAPGIELTRARHPVVEQQVEQFVANDCVLQDARKLLLITGPNMGGKSTFMRQTALVVLLAYVGAFVPAEAATIGPIDRIFTRIGAADDLAGGRSTFMVEMTEAAAILHRATPNSLVLMDEIGRGTSTFDGLALAWAIARHLLSHNRSHTLFATHYFELTQLPQEFAQAANVHLSAVEHGDGIVFLHAVQEGPASQSYGLQVAQLAGVPQPVIRAARKRLAWLEQHSADTGATPQLDLFALAADAPVDEEDDAPAEAPDSALADALAGIDPDDMTPREALDALYRLKALSNASV